MFSPSTDSEEDFDQVLFVLVPIGLVVTHYASWKFWEINPDALFKVGILAWYGIACWLTVVYLVFDSAEWRFADKFFVYCYNCAAQLIAFTGIVDCTQFLWCLAHKQTYKESNIKFLRIYALCSVVTIMIFFVIFTFGFPLHFYRLVSLLLIATEIGGYLQVLRIGWEKFNTSSVIYFIVTSVSRIGIAIGVILRMTLGNNELQGQQIGFIHCMSVMFTLGVVVVFVDEIKTFTDDGEENPTSSETAKSTLTVDDYPHLQISE